jgi:type I restriction-modification system DNA methylase subunit
MKLQDYVKQLNTRYQAGISREHSYRGDLQSLLSAILPDVLVTNEPARIECGAPDYILTQKDIPLGYIEAKDIGVDLKSKTLKEQFDRYRASLNNLIFTDYLDFHFYKDGNFVTHIPVAQIQGGKIVPLSENFDTFTQLIKNFAATISQSIKSPTKLAEMMASRAKLMADVIEKSLNTDDEQGRQSPLKGQMLTFQNVLIHDITNRAFADIYAQTIAYGMFAARYHDPTLPTFSRQEAATLIPKSNPFLRRLFQDIAGYDLDDRLVWIVDELVQIFLASDVADIMHNFGTRTKQEDPVIHFYETFLAAYDPALRKARGVWYTPEPVVNFIVRAVDEILKTEFGLSQGLADTSKTKIKVDVQGKRVEKEVHRVQILDPATGTGTFLAEVIKQIHTGFEGQQGIWSNYVENNLIPRLNGFELLMASYAMAHLKLDLLLTETGYKPTRDQRLRVFLTNSLEESHPDAGTLFSHWLSDEANAANQIKKDAPVMVVLGNPPYAVSSSNKSSWILNLITDYKKGLNERKINLDDDYIKFIRFGQHYIDKNGEGVLAYISNNSFIDGVTHRRMRTSLLESFDKLYVLNLHGNAKKKETTIEGLPDQNVFDIMQGVSINIFVKTGRKKKNSLGEVLYLDSWGKREIKYELLENNNLSSLSWRGIAYKEPFNFFSPVNYNALTAYNSGFQVNELFLDYNSGIQTKNDPLTIKHQAEELESVIQAFKTMPKAELIQTLGIQDSAGWKIDSAKEDIVQNQGAIIDIQYKIFDYRKTYFTGKSSGFIGRTRGSVMVNMQFDNVALIFKRTGKIYGSSYDFFFVSKCVISEGLFAIDPLGREYLAPLYNYATDNDQLEIGFQEKRTPNLNANITLKIVDKIGLRFTNEKETELGTFAPIDLLDYIYAVLHSPTYRETYKEFLKIDFPRVPFPKDAPTFWALVALGSELRQIHLLESPKLEKYLTQYPADGDNVVGKIKYENGNVYINEAQYFANVPPTAWEFYIGGYQPAQKWLKDRKGRELGFEDILHYQKIIVALVETDRIMKEIDKIEVLG